MCPQPHTLHSHAIGFFGPQPTLTRFWSSCSLKHRPADWANSVPPGTKMAKMAPSHAHTTAPMGPPRSIKTSPVCKVNFILFQRFLPGGPSGPKFAPGGGVAWVLWGEASNRLAFHDNRLECEASKCGASTTKLCWVAWWPMAGLFSWWWF